MTGIRFQIPDELEKKFRVAAMKRFGYGKGSLSLAAEDAIRKWIASMSSKTIEFVGDPVEAIEGLLADVELDSVELQHLARKIWIGGVLRDVSR